jgi:hypothetical protein
MSTPQIEGLRLGCRACNCMQPGSSRFMGSRSPLSFLSFPAKSHSRARPQGARPSGAKAARVVVNFRRESDASTLANVGPRETFPGSGMPGQPWEPVESPRRSGLRRQS